MIKIVLKHFVYELSIGYFCNNIIRNFSVVNLITYSNINKSHLHRKVRKLSYGTCVFEINKPAGFTKHSIVTDMEIVSESESRQYRGMHDIEISKKYPSYDYYVMVSYKWSGFTNIAAFAVSQNAEIILE